MIGMTCRNSLLSAVAALALLASAHLASADEMTFILGCSSPPCGGPAIGSGNRLGGHAARLLK